MACFDAENNTYSDLNCECDRSCCLGFLCRCCCDSDKCSWKCLHHTASAICAFMVVLLAMLTALLFGIVTYDSEGRSQCFLFTTYGNDSLVELNTNSSVCHFVLAGELVVLVCALVLIIWFWVKARIGSGAKNEYWTAVLQIFFLLAMLTMAFLCTVIITAGLNHTCSSNSSPTKFPCNKLHYETYDPFHAVTYFYVKIRVSQAIAWIAAAVISVLLLSSLLSVGFTCATNHENCYRHKYNYMLVLSDIIPFFGTTHGINSYCIVFVMQNAY